MSVQASLQFIFAGIKVHLCRQFQVSLSSGPQHSSRDLRMGNSILEGVLTALSHFLPFDLANYAE